MHVTSAAPQPPPDTRPVAAAAGTALAYTPEKAAEIIGGDCKPSYLRALARQGKVSSLWVGKYAFTDAHIREILAYCERPASTAKAAAQPAPAKSTRAKCEPAAPAPLTLAGTVPQLQARAPRRRGAA